MFSGIVEEIGVVSAVSHQPDKTTIMIEVNTCLIGVIVGDSIAINGVCLTICERKMKNFVFEAMPETVRLSTIGLLVEGDVVNVERSMTALSRVGGHLVQGHIDGRTMIENIEQDGCSLKIWFKKLEKYRHCFIPKGYVAIDGMSLTIVDVTNDCFSICFIPHTQHITIVKNYRKGTYVNVEVDHIVKTISIMLDQRGIEYEKHS